jgi:hypothetical protein
MDSDEIKRFAGRLERDAFSPLDFWRDKDWIPGVVDQFRDNDEVLEFISKELWRSIGGRMDDSIAIACDHAYDYLKERNHKLASVFQRCFTRCLPEGVMDFVDRLRTTHFKAIIMNKLLQEFARGRHAHLITVIRMCNDLDVDITTLTDCPEEIKVMLDRHLSRRDCKEEGRKRRRTE